MLNCQVIYQWLLCLKQFCSACKITMSGAFKLSSMTWFNGCANWSRFNMVTIICMSCTVENQLSNTTFHCAVIFPVHRFKTRGTLPAQLGAQPKYIPLWELASHLGILLPSGSFFSSMYMGHPNIWMSCRHLSGNFAFDHKSFGEIPVFTLGMCFYKAWFTHIGHNVASAISDQWIAEWTILIPNFVNRCFLFPLFPVLFPHTSYAVFLVFTMTYLFPCGCPDSSLSCPTYLSPVSSHPTPSLLHPCTPSSLPQLPVCCPSSCYTTILQISPKLQQWWTLPGLLLILVSQPPPRPLFLAACSSFSLLQFSFGHTYHLCWQKTSSSDLTISICGLARTMSPLTFPVLWPCLPLLYPSLRSPRSSSLLLAPLTKVAIARKFDLSW